jgi:excinuclease UvrABC nuclease subunit
MKMCLAPCFKGCTDEEYMNEVDRVRAYFDSRGESLLAEIEAQRDRLSADLDFEAAAQQHAKIAKVKSVLSLCDEICGALDQLDAVVIQPSAEPNSVALFRFRGGAFAGPAQFPAEVEGESVEARLPGVLQQLAPQKARSPSQFGEELSMLKRWYYRTHKAGEIVFAKGDHELPLRKLAHAVGRVYRGEKPVAAPQSRQSQAADVGGAVAQSEDSWF